MTQETLFEQAKDQENRADPYPIFAQLRETPVSLQNDGTYVVSTYEEIKLLLGDPRLSTDRRKLGGEEPEQGNGGGGQMFINLDPPVHDRLRRVTIKHFGPPQNPGRVEGMRDKIRQIVDGLLDDQRGETRMDVVGDFAYPLPVMAICELLGVPPEDEPKFHSWSQIISDEANPDPSKKDDQEYQEQLRRGQQEAFAYMSDLVEKHRKDPGEDMLSQLVVDGQIDDETLVATSIMLLIGGHETSVNLITNGMLTLLRHPDQLERLRREPDLVIGTVEELLRYEPPLQFRDRTTLSDVEIDGTTIPKGAPVVLLLASGSRDPKRFTNAGKFDPAREDNQHLGFGGGVHYCFGAPLARMEVQIALTELVRRVENPRLVQDPPPYRSNPALRGPSELFIDFDRIND